MDARFNAEKARQLRVAVAEAREAVAVARASVNFVSRQLPTKETILPDFSPEEIALAIAIKQETKALLLYRKYLEERSQRAVNRSQGMS